MSDQGKEHDASKCAVCQNAKAMQDRFENTTGVKVARIENQLALALDRVPLYVAPATAATASLLRGLSDAMDGSEFEVGALEVTEYTVTLRLTKRMGMNAVGMQLKGVAFGG